MSHEIEANTRFGMKLAGMVLLVFMVLVVANQMFYHPSPYLRIVRLECPYCNETSSFGITRHNPAGVSHAEVKYCSKCYHTFPVTVYYDGIVSVRQWRDEQ